jgi:heptaprenyl diphosphate synthase
MIDKNSESFSFLKQDLEKLEKYLVDFSDDLDGILRETVKNTLVVGGKRIRPALFLICARNENYDIDYLLPAAASIEIIHTASLIHDDIIDKSILRRGKKTIHKAYDKDTAKFVGDYLLTHTFSILNNYRNLRLLDEMSKAAQNLVKGEFDQLRTKRSLKQDEEIYLEKIKEKTASLFKVSCTLGGILSESNDRDIENMKKFGEYLGISFQINDDLIDLDANKTSVKIGKPVGNDIKQGDLTLPLIYALQNKEFRKKAEKLLTKDNINENDISIILELLEETEALDTARNKFFYYLKKAKEIVSSIEGQERKDGLVRVCNSVRDGAGIKHA